VLKDGSRQIMVLLVGHPSYGQYISYKILIKLKFQIVTIFNSNITQGKIDVIPLSKLLLTLLNLNELRVK